jgi:hypothetical protein
LTEDRLVLKKMNLSNHYHHPQFFPEQTTRLIIKCYLAGNSQAKFIIGCFAYFKHDKKSTGKAMLEEAIAAGDLDAMYSYGVALLCESNVEGINKLLHVLDDEHGKHRIRACRKNLQSLTFGSAHYEMPNIQAYKKRGVGHWNHNGTFPFGDEEFVVTCKRCSVDLEMYKMDK